MAAFAPRGCVKAKSIEPLHLGDIAEVAAIEALVMPTPWSEALFEEELRRPETCFWFVVRAQASEGPRIEAYAGYWRVLDEAHFTNIVVRPECQRQGLGRALIGHCLQTAQSQACGRATLEVRPSNLAAIALYKSFGFEPVALRPKYYSDNDEDALLMWLPNIKGNNGKAT